MRLREAVATSQLPQVKRGQDDDADLRERSFGTADDIQAAVADADRTDAGKEVRAYIIEQAERLDALGKIPEAWYREQAGLKPRKPVKVASAKKAKSGKGNAQPKRKPKRTTVRESVAFRVELREAEVRKAGSAYEATIIREGPGNPNDANAYSREALRKAVAGGLFDGLQAYADHPTPTEERERPERSVRQLVGHFREARYVDGKPAEVRAKFMPITGPGYEWVTSLIESALGSLPGKPLIGISIDGHGDAPDQQEIGGRRYNVVREIMHLGSADIVTRPGAGGMFHRRLQESLAGARASVANPPQLSGRKLQKRVREALQRLESGLAAEDEHGVRRAFVVLQEAATATVKPEPSPRRQKGGAVAKAKAQARKEKQRRKLAEATIERVRTAGRLLREVDVPPDTRRLWLEELTEKADEAAMRRLLERKLAERRDQLAELRESLGIGEIEGVPRRTPSFAAPGPPPGPGLLDQMGIDREELRT